MEDNRLEERFGQNFCLQAKWIWAMFMILALGQNTSIEIECSIENNTKYLWKRYYTNVQNTSAQRTLSDNDI